MSDIHRHRVWNTKRECFITARNTLIDNLGDLYEMKGGLKPLSADIHIVDKCTGRRDTAGDMIYAGDIVSGDFGSGFPTPWLITWSTVHGRTGFHSINRRGQFGDYHGGVPCDCKIIGNVHENPELLEKEEVSG